MDEHQKAKDLDQQKAEDFNAVKKILQDKEFDTEDITLSTKLDGYIDSLDATEIALEIEIKLGAFEFLYFPEEDWKTVGDIVSTYSTHRIQKNQESKNIEK